MQLERVSSSLEPFTSLTEMKDESESRNWLAINIICTWRWLRDIQLTQTCYVTDIRNN